MTVEDCIAEVEQEWTPAEAAFAAKLKYWREGSGAPLILPNSFRAAR
jgi:hypothetical protein